MPSCPSCPCSLSHARTTILPESGLRRPHAINVHVSALCFSRKSLLQLVQQKYLILPSCLAVTGDELMSPLQKWHRMLNLLPLSISGFAVFTSYDMVGVIVILSTPSTVDNLVYSVATSRSVPENIPTTLESCVTRKCEKSPASAETFFRYLGRKLISMT